MPSQQLRCFHPSSDEKNMRGGEEGYRGLSYAEERRMGGWRNETAAVAEMIVHQPGLDRKPGQFFCLFSFLLIYLFLSIVGIQSYNGYITFSCTIYINSAFLYLTM